MEEKKNSAIEKTEEISSKMEKDNKNTQNKNKKPSSKKAVNRSKNDKKAKIREEKAEEKRQAKLQKQEEKEKNKKAHKKASLEKKKKRRQAIMSKKQQKAQLKEQRKALKLEKQAQLKQLKLQKAEERKKRKELLKHETKKQRKQRILKEKQAKLALRKERIADKKAKRLEKANERKEKRLQKLQELREKRKNKRGIGGWLAAVISLGCTVLVLGGLLTYNFFSPMTTYMSYSAENEKSFYDLVSSVGNMDTNLSKLLVSNDNEEKQKLLSEIRVESSLATNSLSSLAIHDEDKYNTTKFVNQVGDYSKYLTNKLIDGEELTEKDIEMLESMYSINNQLMMQLSNLTSQIDENFDFKSLYENKEDNLLISAFKDLESSAVEYPRMIYDGAFSDGTENNEAVALKGLKEVGKLKAEENIKEYFASYGIKELTLLGEVNDGVIPCYYFEGMASDGAKIEIQLSKMGGKIIGFEHYKECETANYDLEKCKGVATEFLNSLGLENMKAVWAIEDEKTITFNFAYEQDGVICYPDLIKVNVCRERGTVSGMEAKSYYLNHTDRQIAKEKVSLEDAEKKIITMNIESVRKVVVPRNNGNYKTAYEFMGTRNGETYYVYVDVETGKELDIFKVVKTTEGTLLM